MRPSEPDPLLAETSLQEVHRDVSAGGVRLRTTEWSRAPGDPNLEAIVAFPGVLAPRQSFRGLANQLGQNFRLIAVDFPGFGESEKPSPQRYAYGAATFAEAMLDLFAGLGLGRAHILGHGLGGTVALHLSARHPEVVRRLALIAPSGHPSPGKYLQLLVAPLVGGLVFRQIIGRSLFSTLYRERVQPNATNETISSYYESFSPPAARAALLATLRGTMDARPVVADSRRIRSATLILWGRGDRLSPVERGRLLSRELPSAGLEILEAGHAPHEEIPELIAPILERFFLGQRAGTS